MYASYSVNSTQTCVPCPLKVTEYLMFKEVLKNLKENIYFLPRLESEYFMYKTGCQQSVQTFKSVSVDL